MPHWHETAEERQRRLGDSNEVWIKGFKAGETQIRPCQLPKDWTGYREHYAEDVGFFPCSEEKDCVGCNDPNEKTKQYSNRYAFNALDANGRLQVYKVGRRLWDAFIEKEKRLVGKDGSHVTDRDYVIVRIGTTFNNTTYDAEAGDKYEVEFPTLHVIGDLLAAKYEQAKAIYDGTAEPKAKPKEADGEPEAEEVKDDSPDPTDTTPDATPTPEPAAEPASKSDDKQPPEEPETDLATQWNPLSAKQVRERLAAWNEANPTRAIEFNERTPRSRMISMAVDEEVPPF